MCFYKKYPAYQFALIFGAVFMNNGPVAGNKNFEPLNVYCSVESENMPGLAPDGFSSDSLELRGYSDGPAGRQVILKTKRYEFSVSSHVVIEQARRVKILAFKNSVLDLESGVSVFAHSATGVNNLDPRRSTLTMLTNSEKSGKWVPHARLEFDCFELR